MKIERLDLNNRIKAQKNQKLKPLVRLFSFEIFSLGFCEYRLVKLSFDDEMMINF